MYEQRMDRIERWMHEGELSVAAGAAVEQWVSEPTYAGFRNDIHALIDTGNLNELEDAFRVHIEFGTGGIRGRMGAGPNRINVRTIGEAAQGLAQHVLKAGDESAERGVVIARDPRRNSRRFAREAACILAANGVTAHLYQDVCATPQLSYSVRALNAAAGIVISASHNPPPDNGFKAYGADGGQVVPPHDGQIIAEARAVTEIERMDYDEAVESGRIRPVPEDIPSRYRSAVAAQSIAAQRDVRIVYTPLHGVGHTTIPPILESLGFRDVHLVETQAEPDGHFPTVPGGVANPEDPRTMQLAIEKAAAVGADLVLSSDPDADRLGCALPDPQTGWDAPPDRLALNGNQIGAVLCHSILHGRKSCGSLPDRPVVCKTIVTTDLTGIVARAFGARVVDNLLVGFKYIGEVIGALSPDEEFVFGTEESHGYLAGGYARDKDAAVAALLLAECAASLKAQGRTVRGYLDEIYAEYGYFCDSQRSVMREGAQGNQEISQIMAGLRANPPDALSGRPVYRAIDRETGLARNLRTGETEPVDGAAGNVLALTLSDTGHTRVTARPSGTEPKIKYYVSASSVDLPDLCGDRDAVDRVADEILDAVVAAADAVLGSG